MLFPILPSSRHRPCTHLIVKGHRTSIYLLQIPNWECRIKWCHHDSFVHCHPQGGAFWIVHEASRWLYQDLGQLREAISGSLLRRRYRDIGANSPCNKTEERRVHQIVCEKVSEYVTLMSEWHDTVYVGRDLSSQYANHTLSLNKSSWMSHLEAVGVTRRASGGDRRQGQGWRKRQQVETW